MSLVRNSNQRVFFDIYNNENDFLNDLKTKYTMFYVEDMGDDMIKLTFWLLAARFGDQAIIGYTDVDRWKLRLFSTVYTYGPVWAKKTSLQKQIRSLTIDQLKETGKMINNTALNPNNDPTTEELDYISSQNTSKSTMADVDALNIQYVTLNDGLDREYTDHFTKLFSKFLLPDVPLYLYPNEEDK